MLALAPTDRVSPQSAAQAKAQMEIASDALMIGG
jgi:hypothetical protein